MTSFNVPFVTISSRQPAEENNFNSGDSTYGSSLGDSKTPSATHDISRVNYHVKRLPDFAKALEDSAARAFPNRGGSQRYKKVHALLLYWDSDDLYVLPELEDLETCFRHGYNFETERFTIPSDNAHLDLTLKIGAMIKEHESNDTLLIVYYGGHARIDEARQSTWCASRGLDSPWLQWSAIQTLLERSLSDALILLDCCAGAASAAFSTGKSITETVSASGWDAIAPDPGRFSFTSTLIEVFQEWRRKAFSVAMLHAEILARLKHPRPERRNGGRFEERTTPVHFMMTANHKAPSIEICRLSGDALALPPSGPSSGAASERNSFIESHPSPADIIIGSEPSESVPHVMISLALEEDQSLNIDDWEQWLSSIPALAKYVQVQGVFKSHSTLLLLSLPVMVWDMLPDHPACNFVAFIRSNNLVAQKKEKMPTPTLNPIRDLYTVDPGSDRDSVYSGTTAHTLDHILESSGTMNWPTMEPIYEDIGGVTQLDAITPTRPPSDRNVQDWLMDPKSPFDFLRAASSTSTSQFLNQTQNPRVVPRPSDQSTLPPHAEKRLEEYFTSNPKPTVAVKEFLASNLNIETAEIDTWFRQRREQQEVSNRLQSLRMDDQSHNAPPKDGARMILPAHLNKLLEMFPTGQIVVMDLRPPPDYQRSHIHGAINFRAPASFVSRASMEMIEKALTDEASRSSFDKWYTSKCVVFYNRVVEYPWEAPVAEAFFQKFRSKHWPGQCFVLKGHYREFSQSFDKYIVGVNTTDKATKYLASLQDVSWEKSKDDTQRYEEWLKLLDGEDRVHTAEPPQAVKLARLQTTVQQQRVLEVEFERAFPYLYRQAQGRKPDDNWSVKAPLVAHLERGLGKMQQEAGFSRPTPGNAPSTTDEGAGGGGGGVRKSYTDPDTSTWRPASVALPEYTRYPETPDHVGGGVGGGGTESVGEYQPYQNQQHLDVWQGAVSALHKASSASMLRGGKSSEESSPGPGPGGPTSTPTSTASLPKGRPASGGGGKNLFTRIMRSGRPDTPSR